MANKVNFHGTITELQTKYGDLVWVWGRQRRRVQYGLTPHYHPWTEELIRKLNTDGLPALFDAKWQSTLVTTLTPGFYTPGSAFTGAFPKDVIDVSDDGPYAIYNWELFFHAPVLIAVHLSKNQRFEEAQRWFHHVFDPTSTDTSIDPPQRFWKFLRFREETDPEFLTEVLIELSKTGDSELKRRMEKAIQAWRDKPFQPHVVARGRYLAYQYSVVMKYLDNLIAWGDHLFRQDTVETLNEATQIYVMAANLLGPKPQRIPQLHKPVSQTYAQLKAAGIDKFGNALIELENQFPFNSSDAASGDASASGADGAVFGIGRTLYFCIPQNDKLLAYWDVVEDRLFKIRHCMNIEGIVRQLALFDPPIDPGVLVKAVAAGLDLASIVNNLNQPVSSIRGPLLLQKAQELCAEVKGLGGALLQAIEKGELEHASLLRQQHELNIQTLTQDVRFLQWKEAEAATTALLKSRGTVWERYRHYKKILGTSDAIIDGLKSVNLIRNNLTEETFDAAYKALVTAYAGALSREEYRKESSVGGLMEFAGEQVVSLVGGKLGETLPLNKNENAELNIFLPTSDTFEAAAMVLNIAAPILALIPQFAMHGTPLGVGGAATFGGVELSEAARDGAKGAKTISDTFKGSADRASKMSGYYRRAEDYVLQANLATSELEQYGRQIITSLLREQVTKREYEHHLVQIKQAAEAKEFLRTKFTNEDLYIWMQGELLKTFYEAYKLAFDVAKKAEVTLKREVMRPELDDQDIIKFGYWNDGKRGLLAGEALALDLKRLEMAYLEANKRELELTKHVSLARLDPRALLRLKATGSCEVEVPEWLFDMDCPGVYLRRLKTVALTIPAVAGPYVGIHCTLSLLRSSVRVLPEEGEQYARNTAGEDTRFRDFTGAIQQVVTSTAQNDSGLFETNLRDDRYLPFEGPGVISIWRLNLPIDLPQFDVESISDVVLHLRYTARPAKQLAAPALEYLTNEVLSEPENLIQLFTLNYDFGNAWHGFASAASDADRKLHIEVTTEMFPYWLKKTGMGDALVATFSVIDFIKGKLTLAPTVQAFTGNSETAWTLDITQGSSIFPFLKKHAAAGATVHMSVSYSAA
ncbi:Tc toxin subunit A-related protein [Actinocorallia populi]|uniref:Tc toxin subunit A-related protein n=1 Tax=Actinocorallia populi TaxID=2079200 RepID=UPI000D093E3D|nr:toxin [Actinocorallia populi]